MTQPDLPPLSECPACQEPVIDAIYSHGGRVLLEPFPSARGPVAAKFDPVHGWQARGLPSVPVLTGAENRYHLHDIDCPGKPTARKAWAAALSRHAASKRRGRHQRPPILRRITGALIPPEGDRDQ